MGEIRAGRFDARLQFADDEKPDVYNWGRIKRQKKQHIIEGYKLQVIEVDGELSDIADIFIRINSTGKPLTSAEKRHAKFYSKSPFLEEANRLAKKLESKLRQYRVITPNQISRMKDVELMCELMLSFLNGKVINKKAALDRVMTSGNILPRDAKKASQQVYAAVSKTLKILPDIKSTRFAKLPDFYSLVHTVHTFLESNLILDDAKRNRIASDLLKAFSTGVDKVRERQRKALGVTPEEELYREYLLTVSEGTDRQQNRNKRHQILTGLLVSLFEGKDDRRGFTPEQRRILWNSSDSRRCTMDGCKVVLTWDDFTMDHLNPHSKGGKSDLKNAVLACRSCNSAKGNRRVRRTKAGRKKKRTA